MEKAYICKLKIGLFVLFMAIISVSILMMPFTVNDDALIPPWISGLLFWVGLAGVAVSTIVISRDRKSSRAFRKQIKRQKQLGLTHFFQNKFALVFDIIMFISIVTFILLSIIGNSYYLQFIFLSIFIFSFGMHCMLNGMNFIYIKYMIRSGDSK